jgi:hypothetical protein
MEDFKGEGRLEQKNVWESLVYRPDISVIQVRLCFSRAALGIGE